MKLKMSINTQQILKDIIKSEYNLEIDNIELKTPPKRNLGDAAFGCFVLSKDLRKSPNTIAEELAVILKKNDNFEDAVPTGPYINLKVSKDIYTHQLSELYGNIENFLSPNIWDNKKIVVDYIGANVWKPLHIGHICTPIIGQTMINIYKNSNFSVVSDSHIGDWGIIFWKLITAYKLWGEKEKLEENAVDYLLELYVKITAEAEKNPDLNEQARQAFKQLSSWDEESKKIWSEFTGYSIKAMNVLLARLNVFPEYNVGESFYEGLGLDKMEDYPDLKFDMHSIVEELISKNIATKNEDNSVWVVFSEESKMPSCILQKRDGTHGYLASDLACIKYRMNNWTPEKIIYFVDVRQKLHFEQAFEIAKQAGWLWSTELIHAYNGFISGKEGAFSSRKGNIIKLDDLLNEAETRAKDLIVSKRTDLEEQELGDLSRMIGIGAIKYGYLKKSRDTDIVFDWDEFMTFEWNSGPYIQYWYVRGKRILSKFIHENQGVISKNITGKLTQAEEIELLNTIQLFPEVIEKTISTNMPHYLCAYAFDITKTFSSFYNSVHILNETDSDLQMVRIQLVDSFCKTLYKVFDLLGIELPEKM